MSQRYRGARISATPPTTDAFSAPGVWTLQQQFQAGSTWPPARDPDFEYVTLLLPGNGTNGAQNNTFLGTNSIVANNPGGFSVSFSGATTSYLSVPSSTQLDIGTNQFTLEAWVYLNAYTSNPSTVCGKWRASGNRNYILLIGTSGTLEFAWNSSVDTVTAGTVPLNTWTHVAVSRDSSNVMRLFVNGQIVTSKTVTTSIGQGATEFFIGQNQEAAILNVSGWALNGYVSNLRMVVGTALYTAAFTVPAAPLTAVTNTRLLTCQSATLVDNSTNNFTVSSSGGAAAVGTTFSVTRNGNTTQGTFSPYGSNWSNYWPGTGELDGLTLGTSLLGSSNFTLEFWVNIPSLVTSGGTSTFMPLVTNFQWFSGATNASILIAFNPANNSIEYTLYTGGGSASSGAPSTSLYSSASAIKLGQWHHIAVTRNGANLQLFIDGASAATGTLSSNTAVNFNTRNIYIGRFESNGGSSPTTTRYFIGYVSNFRLVVGSVLYTSNFTPSIVPLTAVTNTSRLTCQSNRFIDNSSSNFAITVNGNVSVQEFSPFSPAAAYSASTNGGSGYFDGSGDYLTVPANTAFDMGSGNFTVECWVYPINTTAGAVCRMANANSFGGFGINWTGSTFQFLISYNGTSWAITPSASFTVAPSAWHHVALVRNGATVTLYINGVSGATANVGTNSVVGGSPVFVGWSNFQSEFFPGYISNLRIVKGTAVYTAGFTPPTAPLTNITNTSALLNFTNAGIIDNAMMNNLETVGNAQISTAQSKFGGGSLAFDGSGDYLSMPHNPSIDVGGGAFTIEAWIRTNNIAFATYQAVVTKRIPTGTTNAGYSVAIMNNGNVAAWNGTTLVQTSGITLVSNTWYHIAWVHTGTNLQMYVDGTRYYNAAYTMSPNTYAMLVGATAYNGSVIEFFNGYIDDLRITKGVARYTANFTPPGVPFYTV